MTINDILNYNKLNMRHKDHFVIILKSGNTCFTLGEYRFHSWVMGELELNSYVYTNMCLHQACKYVKIDLVEYKLIKIYIDNEDLQADIYLMEDNDYNKKTRARTNEKNTESF